jgi:preprotein translocase subunit SecG
MLVLAWNAWVTGLLTVGFLGVCILMVLTVLIQKPQGGGLASAFGGGAAGSGQTAFGTKTGDALTIFTIIIFVVYLLFAVLLGYATRPGGVRGVNETAGEPTPVETAPAETAPAAAPTAPAS